MVTNTKIKQFVKRCQKSVSFFIESCCKIKHPEVGVIPVKLFKYQRSSLASFRSHRFNIFKKCRQCGASTLTGMYALWVALFFGHKKILIVSKRDTDAKDFLESNVKFVYDRLPTWMREIWKDVIRNEHELGFPNGSVIRSLTSSTDTLRSNASFLNIIDEAAFMPDMEGMWAGGWSTLQHGGSAIIISTPNGIGNWYWDKWMDSQDPDGLFSPILINWWDMDWVIDAMDPISNRRIRIAPTDGITKCTTKEDIEKFGPYKSPWLAQEYKGLQLRGEAHLFKQEILADFIGSGGTVLDTTVLYNVGIMVENAPETMTVAEPVNWVNQATGDTEVIDFVGSSPQEGLWVWKEPFKGEPTQYRNGKIVKSGVPGHTYVMGIDIATGENNDYSAIEVFDINTMEQVAEFMGHVQVQTLAKMADWMGRWYNNALINPERTGIGAPFVQDIQNLIYPNIWRRKKARTPKPNSKTSTSGGITLGLFGFATSGQTKPTLNKALIDYIKAEEEEGYEIYSERLHKQLQIYIRHRDRRGIETKRTGAQEGRGNHDDLVIAAALAFVAAPDAINLDPTGLMPTHSKQVKLAKTAVVSDRQEQQQNIMDTTDHNVIVPLSYNSIMKNAPTQEEQLANFTKQLTSSTRGLPAVKLPKHNITMRPRR